MDDRDQHTTIECKAIIKSATMSCQEMANMLHIMPSSTSSMGSFGVYGGIIDKHTWKWTTGERQQSYDGGVTVSSMMRELLDVMHGPVLGIKEYVESGVIDVNIVIVLYIGKDDRPLVHLDRQTIGQLASIGSNLGVSMY